MKIAVTGATGRLGHHVVDALTERKHDVVAISRSHGVDLISGDGLRPALTGVRVIVDCATGSSPDGDEATKFFTAATANLQTIGVEAGVQRVIVVSIIGIDRGFVSGYNVAKLAHERAALAGPIPVRILRAAQFHEFVEQLMQWRTRDGVVYVPGTQMQLVAARTVAEALIDLAIDPTSAPAASNTPTLEIAGPRAESLFEMARLLAQHRGGVNRIECVTESADPDAELYAAGGLLPSSHATLAGPTFADWLAAAE